LLLRQDEPNRTVYAVFGVAWSTAVMAAALDNYPTPIVGYGGSAIVGYLWSLGVLPKRLSADAAVASPIYDEQARVGSDRHLLVRPA